MSDPSSAALYATFLANCIRDELGVEIPDHFAAQFLSHVRRLGSVDYEDFGSLVLLECEEKRRSRQPLDEQELLRLLDRIRHRVVRKARRELPLETAQFQ